MSNSTRSNNSIRIIGFIAALASIGTACGGATTTTESLTSPTAVPGIAVDDVALLTDNQTAEVALGSDPAADTAPTPQIVPTSETTPAEPETPAEPQIPAEPETPAEAETPTEPQIPAEPETPAEAETPTAEPTVEPNVAPVIDSMRVTRHGLEVTVELNASDGNNDPLTLSVLAVDDRTSDQFRLTEQTDAHTFTFNFEYNASVTLVGSVTDGQEEATQVGHIDIATLKVVNIDVGYVTVAKNCLAGPGSDTYTVVGDQSIIGLSTSDYKPNLYYYDVIDTTMTFQEPGGQLLRKPQSLEFEQNLGFQTHFEIHGQFRDITVDYLSVKTEAGSEQKTFWSPSNDACWLKVGYKTTVTDA
jgi:hypothetical protein